MLVSYNGELLRENPRIGGCSKCGTGRSINGTKTFRTSWRTYYGGRFYNFEMEKPVEVDEILGKFLLGRTYKDDNGDILNSFKEITDSPVEVE